MHLKKGKKTMNLVEVNGKTVEEAIARALKKLGLPKKDVEVEIVSSGKAGFLGLGSEDAVVRVTAKKGTNARNPNKKNYTQPVKKSYSNTNSNIKLPLNVPGRPKNLPVQITSEYVDKTDLAGKTIRDILNYLGFADTTIKASNPKTEEEGLGRIEASFNITPKSRDLKKDLGILIGKSGFTIRSLQTIVGSIVSQQTKENTFFNIDIDSYKSRKNEALSEMAMNIADEIRITKDPVTLEPMPASERRIIHLAIEKEDLVASRSIGKGLERKVEIYLEKKD